SSLPVFIVISAAILYPSKSSNVPSIFLTTVSADLSPHPAINNNVTPHKSNNIQYLRFDFIHLSLFIHNTFLPFWLVDVDKCFITYFFICTKLYETSFYFMQFRFFMFNFLQ